MTIKKGEKQYQAEDCGTIWRIRRTVGGVEVTYTVNKALAPDTAALESYILSHDDLF